MRRAGLNLPVPVAARDRRWLRLTRRSLDQRGRTAALPRAGRRGSRHYLDAGALLRRIDCLLEQAQDQSDVAGHRVFQRGHLSRQLIDPGVDLLDWPTRAALKVAWKDKRLHLAATRARSRFEHSSYRIPR